MAKFKDTDMQVLIGWILRIGVLISVCLVFIGGLFYIYRHGHDLADYKVFKGIPLFLQSGAGIIDGIVHLRGRAIIQAGIILLIATPVMRIAFSAIGFVLERDFLYTGITLLVFIIIIASMLGGHIV